MTYELSSLDVIAALPIETWPLTFIPFIIVGIVFYRTGFVKNILLICVAAVLLPAGIILFTIHDSIGDGWRLNDTTLRLKAWMAQETIELSSTRIELTDASGPWQPVRRTYGRGMTGLSEGWFNLQNGAKAIVFYHRKPARMLVLKSGGQIYVIAHPGIEKLQEALIARGVKEFQQEGTERERAGSIRFR